MKKLYTAILAASVAASAAATPARVLTNETAVNTQSAIYKMERAFNAKATNDVFKAVERIADTTVKAPAKAAATNMGELIGVYDYSFYLYSNAGGQTLNSTTTIAAGEEENEVLIQGMRYVDVTLKGTVDFAAGTITLTPQELLTMPEDPDYPGKSMDIWLYAGKIVGTSIQEDRNANITIKLNADGTLSSEDIFIYGVEGLPGASYAVFEDLKMAPSEYNAKAEYGEYDTDEEGNFLPTVSEYVTYCMAEHLDSYIVADEQGNQDDLGEVVTLDDFIFSKNQAITATYPLPIIIERDTKTTYLDTFYWFDASLQSGDYRVAVCTIINSRLSGIEGSFAGSTISWGGDWYAYAPNAGIFGKFKDCKIYLQFSLDDNAGINDVVVDNENAPVEYFNLQGMRVNEPAAGQFVIRRQGNKVEKIIVK